VSYSISIDEVDRFINNLKAVKHTSKAFRLATLQVILRGYHIKLGSRSVYVDFPRGIYTIQMFVLNECNNIIAESDNIRKGVDSVKTQRNDLNSNLGFLTSILKKLGISWNIVYAEWYKKPVIKFHVNKYFESYWVMKIKRFVEDLNRGNDDPRKIYNRARTLTPEYLKIMEATRRPVCFDILFASELSPYREIEALMGIVNKFYRFTEGVEHPVIKERLTEIITDIKTSIYGLKTVVESGHVFGGYLLLRKILTSFSLVIFFHLLIKHIYKPVSNGDLERDDDLKKDLQNFVLKFPSEWKIIQPYGDFILIGDMDRELKTERTVPIQDLRTFLSIRDKILREKPVAEPKDKFLMELLDFLNTQSGDIFLEEIHSNTSSEAWNEYKKLSKIVHDPILVDYPPFSSTLEYIGFVHHLRKVRYTLEKALLNYSKVTIKGKKKR